MPLRSKPQKSIRDMGSTERRLYEQIGSPLITTEELAKLLHYANAKAVRAAYYNGTFPLTLYRGPGNRLYGYVEEVAGYLESGLEVA